MHELVPRGLGAFGGLVLLLVAVTGCTAGSGSPSSGPGGGASCESSCKTIVAAGCPNDTQASCVDECQQELAPYSECASELGAVLSCATAKIPMKCNVSGKAGMDLPPGVSSSTYMQAVCPNETQAFTICEACVPRSDDTPTEACMKSNCCAEFKSFFVDNQRADYQSCVDLCTSGTQACMDSCKSQYPSAGAKMDTMMSCTSAHGC